MPRNAEVIRQWTILRDLESARRLTHRRDGGADRRHDAHHPARSRGAAGSRLPALRRSPRRQALLDARAARLPASRRHGLQSGRAERPVLHAGRWRNASRRRRFNRMFATRSTSSPRLSRPGMRQFLDRLPLAIQAKADPGVRAPAPAPGDRAGLETGSARGATARRHAASPARRDALPLVLEQPRQGLRRRAAAARVRAGRPLSAGVRPRIQRAAHVLGRSDPGPVADRGSIRAERRCRRTRSRTRSACIRARRSRSRSPSSR